MDRAMYQVTSVRAVAMRLLALTPGAAPRSPVASDVVRAQLLAEYAQIDQGRLAVAAHHTQLFAPAQYLEAFPQSDDPPFPTERLPNMDVAFRRYLEAIRCGKRNPTMLSRVRESYVNALLHVAGVSAPNTTMHYPTMWVGSAAHVRFNRARCHATASNLTFLDLRWIAPISLQLALHERPRFFADADLRGAIAAVDVQLLLETAGADLSTITWIQ